MIAEQSWFPGDTEGKKAAWISSYCFLLCFVVLLFLDEIYQTHRKGKDYYSTHVPIFQI